MLDSIQSAIQDIRDGKLVIVVDDEDRENEGDFVTAIRFASPEVINFMTKQGRGLICAALPEEKCDELGLELMVNNNTAQMSPRPCLVIKLITSGLANLMAVTKSPSFSRSSS